ncbi:MAG: DUF3037 domain-containing protein [Terriglobia bacterium]
MGEQANLKPCSYFVVRYAANLLRSEGLNIGVLLHCPDERYLGCLFASDFRWVRRFDLRADIELLGELQRDFEEQFELREPDPESYLRELAESLSNTIQLEGPRACLLEDPALDIQDLYARNVGRGTAALPAEDTRVRVKQRLTAAFVHAGVWDLLEKRIPGGRWTQPGDPFTFDYGYQHGGAIRLIHALSLRRDTQLAKTLVYTLDCARRQEPASLTAVVEGLPRPGDRIALATRSILEEGRIALQPVEGVGVFAHAVRAELRVA